jgi:hypothetical protein
MVTKTWKAVELRIATFFGGVRNWLSGAEGGGDVAIEVEGGRIPHPTLYISIKHYSTRLSRSVWSLMEEAEREARKEKKKPVLVLHKKHSRKTLVCIWMDTFKEDHGKPDDKGVSGKVPRA